MKSHPEYRAKQKSWAERFAICHEIQKAIDDINFDSMNKELLKSASLTEILAAKTAKFDRAFFKDAEKKGMTEMIGGRKVLTAEAQKLYDVQLANADLLSESQKQQLKNEKELKAIRDVSFDGLMEDLDEIARVKGLTEWEKKLSSV